MSADDFDSEEAPRKLIKVKGVDVADRNRGAKEAIDDFKSKISPVDGAIHNDDGSI